jgi:hypothetical protein
MKEKCYVSLLLLLVVQASRLLANLIVVGSGVLARALVQAYRQALSSMFFHFTYNKEICLFAANSAWLVFV